MPKRIFSTLCSLLFSFSLFSQDNSFNFEKNHQKALQYIFSKPDSAKFYLDLMVKNITNNIPDTSAAKIYNNLGLYYSQVSKLDSAKIYFTRAIEKNDKKPKNKASSLLNLANVYRNEANYSSSLKHLKLALAIFESIDEKVGVAMVYGEIGSNYAYMLENKKAIDYFTKGIKILETTNEKQRLAVLKQKLANLYLKTKDYDFAIEMYEDCLSSMKETNDMKNYYLTLINYGDCLIMVQKYKTAQKVLLEAIDGLEPFQSNELTGLSHNKLSRVFLFEDNIALSLKHSKIAYDYIKQSGSFRTMRVAAEYIEILNLTEKYKEALEVIDFIKKLPNQSIYNIEDQMIFESASAETFKNTNLKDLALKSLENVSMLKDSISSINKEVEIQEMQAKFQTKTQYDKNKTLEEKNRFLDEKIKAQNKNYIFLGIIIVILITTIIAFATISGLRYKLQLSKLKETENEKERILRTREEELKEAEKQKQILSLRDQELTSAALQLADMQEKIISIINNNSPDLQKAENIKNALQNLVKQEDYWKKFSLKFSQIHPNFESSLKGRFPVLTKNDIDFISLMKLNLSNKEIATLLQISHESVISKKYRVKKKMNIEDDETFNKIILDI